MGETVYVKAGRNTEVSIPDVKIGDVMKVECADAKMQASICNLRLLGFKDTKGNNKVRSTVSIMEVISIIHDVYPKVEVQNMGESDFIVSYEKKKTAGGLEHVLKVLLVVIISFTGAAFSIMSFNNDVDIKKIFAQIFELTTGMKSDGFTVIELFYSIGISVGILIFFNHFGKKRFTTDPTPIEVEMRLYENDLQTTLIEDYSRKGTEMDVDTKCRSGSNWT